ncbi:MAG: dihydropteroate synthase [Lachnospiraceae bacterium]|nr:dihydropteroate synthase [Lachnospiraceae bacterium]
MQIGNIDFEIGRRPYIMGILNVTPDSFSDGGNYNNIDRALERTREMIAGGADIIDVGGESTRPGHVKISEQEEIERTCFIIEAIKENFNIPVSLDTYKAKVAQAGILAGADMINDIWGLKWNDKMAETIAHFGVACCLMHNRHETVYGDFLRDVVSDLQESIEIALSAGVSGDKLMIDPGVGFAKDTEQNLAIMNNLKPIVDIGYPVLLGTSRKSMIGNTLDLPVDERLEGTIATSVIGLLSGCSFFRVHDVRENYRALKMADAIMKSKVV